MDETESAWLTREEIWQRVVNPLLADPVVREAYDFRWEDYEGLCLYLEGHDQGPYLSFCTPERSFSIGYEQPCEGFRVHSFPLPEGMAEEDWPAHAEGIMCVIDGAGHPGKEAFDLVYGDPVNLMPKADLLAMVKEILWIMAGATSARARSAGEPWRAERKRSWEDFLATRPDLDPDDFLAVIPRYVVDVESRRSESITRSFANLEFRLNMPG